METTAAMTLAPHAHRPSPRPYSSDEVRTLKNISRRPKEHWRPALKQFVINYPERDYNSAYNKVYRIAGGMEAPAKRAVKKKIANKPKSSQRHPMKRGELAVSQKELRFPYKSIRIENGEVVISI